MDEVRPISVRVGVLPRTHGSGLFTRGQTQVLNICTLAPLSEKQTIDGIGIETEKRYIHHYNFPSYSVGEARSSRGPGRREIGHGALAERALLAVLQQKKNSHTLCVWYPKYWNPTAPAPWPACAVAPCP